MAPDERILVLSIADLARLRQWAEAAPEGALVGVGSAEEVRAARRELSAFEHVMFVEGDRDDIPWKEAWFSVIIDAPGGERTREMERVLAPGGRVLVI